MICIPIHSICLNFYTYYFWVSFLFKILQWQKKTSKIIIITSTQTLNFKKIWENRSFSCIKISKLIRSKSYIKKKIGFLILLLRDQCWNYYLQYYLNDGKYGEMGAVNSGEVSEDPSDVAAISPPVS